MSGDTLTASPLISLPGWTEYRSLPAGVRSQHWRRLHGMRLMLTVWPGTIEAVVEQRRAGDGGWETLARRRVDAQGGGGNVAGVRRQIVESARWAESRAIAIDRKESYE